MAAASVSETQLQALVDAVDRADQVSNPQEAERCLAQANAAAPDHPGVLNVAGMRALRSGDTRAAREMLQRAVKASPDSPMLWLNLAFVHRTLQDEGAEREAIDKSLEMNSRFELALLYKAHLFERQGKIKHSAYLYHAYLC